ncbi:hypothetical protein [Ruminiclostridium cellobioparum]|uniref:hypothetical protein n=1 Tax=Ruminiclostridium cellobioparum TaxID=29355 RepID=UPI0028AE8E03|nr:hypothetical protein [Ruminiclostridium cellobioparum]
MGWIIACRNKLLAMPLGISVKLVGQRNPNVIINLLTKEVKIALDKLAAYDANMFVRDDNGE